MAGMGVRGLSRGVMNKPVPDKAQLITLEAMQAAATAVMNSEPHPRQGYGPVFLAIRAGSTRVEKNTQALGETKGA